MRFWLSCTLVAILLVFPRTGWAQTATGVPVKAVKLTVLSTMLVGTSPSGGIGEWGFSALLEVDGRECSSIQAFGPRLFFETPKSSASTCRLSPTSC